KEIQTKIDEIVEETRKEAKEIEKEHLKIYQESASFVPANVNIDYKVYYQSNHILSFVINKTVIQASSYVEKMVYNLDLDSGEKLTLQSLLGNDYKTIVNTQIEKQIQERLKNDSNAFFYDDANKFTTIKDNQNFYINKEGKIVILFDKYEIAPGYMGNLEFTLINTIK
ncbi:MAG: DUF3298 domain-containing protein, partial [Erysipelotrichia bacterium]|nr:DUF3298 domain-containing protein [Erysipelotrichia bacterium]